MVAGGGSDESPRAARMFEAVQGLERRMGRRVTLDELGAWVAEREGRTDAYAGSVVRRWLKGLSEPRGSAGWQALAEVLGVSPGWLVFGEPAPTPGDATVEIRPPGWRGQLVAGAAAERKKPRRAGGSGNGS